MSTPCKPARFCALLLGAAVLAFAAPALADPPSRVARLGYAAGAVSFSPAGEEDWVRANVNRPLGSGDRLWSEDRGRAEIQVGGAMLRMGAATGVSVLNLDDRIAQFQLTQGTLIVRVRRLDAGQAFEVDTPNLAFVLRQPGEYRISVEPDRDETTIVVRQGEGEAYGDGTSYLIDARQPYRFSGTDLRDYDTVDAPRADEFDRWARDRDRAYDSSPSARYVSRDVVGYQDLDDNGSWRSDPEYGNVWIPSRVPAGWAPYRDGHWAWIDPWGWTWVDDAPWGYAVSHYGRWANLRGTWGWVPGPVSSPAYYAPALVVFVGGANFQLSISSGAVGGVAWFPLAPREVYRPSYTASRGYFENVNRSNTVINTTVINNVYNNININQVVYANRQVAGAVVAVPATTFVQSQPVARAAVRVTQEMVVSRPVAVAPTVAPTVQSVHGATVRGDAPPARVFERPVIAHTAPAIVPAGIAAQQAQLAARPGKPLEEADRKALRPAAAQPAQAVKVLAPTAQPARAMVPVAPGASGVEPTRARLPTPTPAAAPAAIAPTPVASMPERRALPEPRVPAEARRPPAEVAMPVPTPAAVPVPASAAAPPVPMPIASAPARADRGRPEPRAQAEPRPTPEARPIPEVRTSPEARPVPEVRASPQARPTPEARTNPQARPTPEARPSPEARPTPEVRTNAEARPSPEPRPGPELRNKPPERERPAMRPPEAAAPPAAAPSAPAANRPAPRQRPDEAAPSRPAPQAAAPDPRGERQAREPGPAASRAAAERRDREAQRAEEERKAKER